MEFPEPLRRGVYVVWTQYLPVQLHVGLVTKSPLLERFRMAFRLSGLTSGFLSAALEAPAGLLVDTFRALISGRRRTECPGTNSASALSPGDPGYM